MSKQIVCVLGALIALASRAHAAPINAIVGDASWIERYGHAPTPAEQRLEDERHRVHLLWIERQLRAAPTDHLGEDQRQSRARLLDALADYTRRGIWPVNDPGVGARPRFIDREGRICAVGYLIEVSAGRKAAEAIDAAHEYELLLDIHDPELDRWIESSGFTARELASIQPIALAMGGDEMVAALGYTFVVAPGFGIGDLAFSIADAHAALHGGYLEHGVAVGQAVYGALQLASALAIFYDALNDRQVDTGQLAMAIVGAAFSVFQLAYAGVSLAADASAMASP